MQKTSLQIGTVDIDLSLDDSTLPVEPESFLSDSIVGQIRDLKAEREAAFRQMQCLMHDIKLLRAKEQGFEVSRQSVMADMMFRMALVAETRKGGGVENIVRVGVMSALLSNEMACDSAFCDAIQLAAPLRDMGWAALPDYWQGVDQGELSERKRLQTHCALGELVLNGSEDPAMVMAATIASSHHERHNGSGYPKRLSGENIPLEARIVGCIDAFDALIQGNGLQSGMTPDEAMEEVVRADIWFHRDVRAALERISERVVVIHGAFDDSALTDDLRLAFRRQWRPGFWRCFLG